MSFYTSFGHQAANYRLNCPLWRAVVTRIIVKMSFLDKNVYRASFSHMFWPTWYNKMFEKFYKQIIHEWLVLWPPSHLSIGTIVLHDAAGCFEITKQRWRDGEKQSSHAG